MSVLRWAFIGHDRWKFYWYWSRLRLKARKLGARFLALEDGVGQGFFDGGDVGGGVQDEVGMGFAGGEVAAGGGEDGVFVLPEDKFHGALALGDVANFAAMEADRFGGFEKNGKIEVRAKLREMQGEDAFDDEQGAGRDVFAAILDAQVLGEIVNGGVDGVAGGVFADVGFEERDVDGGGRVVVDFGALFERELGHFGGVGFHGEDVALEAGGHALGDGGFAAAGGSGEAHDEDARGVGRGVHEDLF